jgi:uncharacterized C2H2 Zn-finger protein
MEENVLTNTVSEIEDMKKSRTNQGAPPVVKCPRCGEDIDKRGFSGHMKFVHGESKERTKIIVTEKSVTTKISEIMAELDDIHKKRASLNETIKTSGARRYDSTPKELLDILDVQEEDLLVRVKELRKSLVKN